MSDVVDNQGSDVSTTPNRSLSAFPARLKLLRERNMLSQQQLALKLQERCNFKVDNTLISKWENGVYKPTGTAITALVNLFKVTPGFLLGRDERPSSDKARFIVAGRGEVFAIWVEQEEADLLDKFRRINSEEKRAVKVLVNAFFAEKRKDPPEF